MDSPEEVDKRKPGGRASGRRDEDKSPKLSCLTPYDSSVFILLHLFIKFVFPLLKILLRWEFFWSRIPLTAPG